MKLHVEYFNSTPDFDYKNIDIQDAKYGIPVVEVDCFGGVQSSNELVKIGFLDHLRYALRDLRNIGDTGIKKLELSEIFFLTPIEKTQDDVKWGDGLNKTRFKSAKYDVIIYDIAGSSISEKMYLTRNSYTVEDEVVHLRPTDLGFEGNIAVQTINSGVLVPGLKTDSTKLNIAGIFALTEKYIKGYNLAWDKLTKSVVIVSEKDGSIIKNLDSYDETKNMPDDIYIFFKLYNLLVEKGNHTGVYFINAMNMKVNTLKGIFGLLESYFGTGFLAIIYNTDKHISQEDIPRHIINLPNYTINK